MSDHTATEPLQIPPDVEDYLAGLTAAEFRIVVASCRPPVERRHPELHAALEAARQDCIADAERAAAQAAEYAALAEAARTADEPADQAC